MKVQGCTALVTGANQGIGRGFVEVLLERGAARVYATARRPETLADLVALDPKRVVALPLDITNAAQRHAVFAQASDINLLINNAGIAGSETPAERRFLGASSLDDARTVMETDCWAHVEMCRGFAPHLIRNNAANGSAIINIISIGALFCVIEYSSYSAAKSALAMATIGLRAELEPSNVSVHGVFTGAVESRMSAKGTHAKATAPDHAREVLSAVEAGKDDIYAGLGAQAMYDEIRKDPEAFQRGRIARYRSTPMK
ncbi:MAG: SDR family NAD(P)-dependent oxidoreductase [Rhodospirillaceae bacterium]|nr:SDR family NAD(P)-dependent oxidoreductase [Rhodospirillaceae bacterium]